MPGTPARRIEDATPQQTAVEWKVGALCLAGAALFAGMFGLPRTFDINAAGFNPLTAVPLVLAGYGAVQLGRWALSRRSGYRFGASAFDMHQHTVRVGQQLAGRIVTTRDLAAADGFRLCLRCHEHRRLADPAGQGYRDDDRLLWESAHMVTTPRSHTEGIPVAFDIPRDAAAGASGHPLRWTLEVEASVDGVRFAARFDVPVTRPRDDDGSGDEDPMS